MVKSIRVIVFLVAFLSTSLVFGQSYIGVFGGLNSSRLSGDAPEKASYKGLMGANVGAYLDINLGKGLSLSFQPSYSQEGTKVSYKVSGLKEPVDSLKIRLNYFSLPIFLKVTSTKERFYALAGIETGLLTDSFISSHDKKLDIETTLSEINVAMHFGAGFRIPVGKPRLFIELRYTQGLTNITDEPIEESYIPRVKTTGLKVLFGVELPISNPNN